MKKHTVKGFTLLESLVSLTILSIVTLLLFTAFIKIDNERTKRNKVLTLILLDKYEYKLREKGQADDNVLSDFQKEAQQHGLYGSSEKEMREGVLYLTLSLSPNPEMSYPHQKIISLQTDE